MSERFPICRCDEPQPRLVEAGRVWVCDECGNLTHDPSMEAQILSLLSRIDQRVQAAIDLRLGQITFDGPALLTVDEVIERTGLSYYQVREKRDALGCVSRKGAPLRFAAARVEAFVRGETPAPPPPERRQRKPRKRKTQTALLPIKGER